MTKEYTKHFSVLKRESIELLTSPWKEKGPALFGDLTFGGGGHTKAILEEDPLFQVVAFDQDPEAIAGGKELILREGLESRLTLVHKNFQEIEETRSFQGFLLDLGVSSHHFDEATRGFSFLQEGPLDMRMNSSDDNIPTAADLLNTSSYEELVFMLQTYGEEVLSPSIARAIIEEREKTPFETTSQLEKLVFHQYPKKWRYGRTHPATKTFQALRLAVNQELLVLEKVLPKLLSFLAPQGRVGVITFHSLEDRIVKHTFKAWHKERLGTVLTKKPILPSEEELALNKRSRSAKLRFFEKK